jgi:hypothetical protein
MVDLGNVLAVMNLNLLSSGQNDSDFSGPLPHLCMLAGY